MTLSDNPSAHAPDWCIRSFMVKFSSVVCCCLLATSLGAVDADPKTQARTLYSEAAKNLDVWTLIQLEAWGERNGVKMRSVLTGVDVIGDPLLATPSPIAHVHNQPNGVVLTSRERIYQFAPDGRPLAQSWRLPGWPWEDTVEPSGKAFGMSSKRDKDNTDDRAFFMVAAIRLADGVVVSRTEIEGPRNDGPGHVAVASDGSAVAAQIYGNPSRILMAIGDKQSILPGWRRPRSIGKNGHWLIAENPKGEWSLRLNDEQSLRIRDEAIGPDSAAVMIKSEVSLVKDDGSLIPMQVPIGFGNGAALTTIGNWLIVSSGEGATSKAAMDVLGNISGGGQPQPPTCAFYRWRDLLANPAAEPVTIEAVPLRIAKGQAAAVYRWRGTALELIDLSGDEIAFVPLATAPADITDVFDDFHVTNVGLADGQRWLLNASGAEILGPTRGRIEAQSATWALMRDGDDDHLTFTALRLSPEAASRSVAKLEVQPGRWNAVIPIFNDQVYIWNNDGIWSRVDPYSGKVVAKGDAENRQGAGLTHDPDGRFYARGPRLFAKRDPPPVARPFCANDVWRMGKTVAVLDRDQHVWVNGRKRNEWTDLGWVPGAWRFARTSADPLVVINGDNEALISISAAGKLETPKNTVSQDLPAGLWQAHHPQFVPPRAGNQTWNADTGLWPDNLRCADADGLLVPLGAVVLVLDATAGKALGRPR